MEVIANKYKVIKVLGKGGFGCVYLAKHANLGTLYAVKILHKNISGEDEFQSRFIREAQTLQKLNHPYSVPLRDFGETEQGDFYMAMDFCEGMDLTKVLETEGPLPAKRVLKLVSQILEVLVQAHELAIVHRDLKPDNIMVVRDSKGRETVRVLDFGLAKIRGGQKASKITQEGVVMGTPFYMSPEQAGGNLDLDGRSDIYSLGMVMYEMLTAQRPLDAQNLESLLLKQMTKMPDPFDQRFPGHSIPDFVEAIVFRALAKQKEDRYQSASQFLRDCQQALFQLDPKGASADFTTGGTVVTRVASQRDKRAGFPWGILLLLALLAGGGAFGFYWLQGQQKKARKKNPIPKKNLPQPEEKAFAQIQKREAQKESPQTLARAYRAFLAKHPKGKWAKKATQRLEELNGKILFIDQDQRAYERARLADKTPRDLDSCKKVIAEYQKYLQIYPRGLYQKKVKTRLAILQKQLSYFAGEQSRWTAIQKDFNRALEYQSAQKVIKGTQSFLLAYPKGPFVQRAQEILKALEAKSKKWKSDYQAYQTARQREVEGGGIFKQMRCRDGYRDYLKEHPKGLYRQRVKKRIDQLNKIIEKLKKQ